MGKKNWLLIPEGSFHFFTQAGCIAAGVGWAFSRICLFVRAVKGK